MKTVFVVMWRPRGSSEVWGPKGFRLDRYNSMGAAELAMRGMRLRAEAKGLDYDFIIEKQQECEPQ